MNLLICLPTLQGRSPSQQLNDLQKRRSELVAQLTKTDHHNNRDPSDHHTLDHHHDHRSSATMCSAAETHSQQQQVKPSSASAISNRIYERKWSESADSASSAQVQALQVQQARTADVQVDIAKTHLTFSDQLSQAHQPTVSCVAAGGDDAGVGGGAGNCGQTFSTNQQPPYNILSSVEKVS